MSNADNNNILVSFKSFIQYAEDCVSYVRS